MDYKLAATYTLVNKLHYISLTLFVTALSFYRDMSFPKSQNLWLSFLLSPNRSHLYVFPLGCSRHHDVSLILLKCSPHHTKIFIKHSVHVNLSI